MKNKFRIYGRICLAILAILIGFMYAQTFSSLLAIIMSLSVAFVACLASMAAMESGRQDYYMETFFSQHKIQMIRFGRKGIRVRYYLICIFLTLASCYLFSFFVADMNQRFPLSQPDIFWKLFCVSLAPSIIGLRMMLGDAGIEDKCPYCRMTFAAPKDQEKVSCPYCEKEIGVSDKKYFYELN